MNKILIISDIHGSKEASEKLVSLDYKYNFERIIVLGDINYNGARNAVPLDYSPKDVSQNLLKLKEKLTIIKGNCDSRVDEFVLGIKFNDLLEETINGHHFIMTHGDLYSPNDFDLKPGDVYLYGHTHVYKLEKENGHFIINPGSTTFPKESILKTYIIYDLNKDEMALFELNEDKFIKNIELNV